MSEETKKCPFCGEEILAIAIKCKHCQSMLNGITEQEVAQKLKNIRFQTGDDVKIPAIDYLKGAGGVILAIVAIFFAGWLYVWSCSIPFVFWLMPLIYGCLAGLFMFLAIRLFRTDDIGVFITFGLLGGGSGLLRKLGVVC